MPSFLRSTLLIGFLDNFLLLVGTSNDLPSDPWATFEDGSLLPVGASLELPKLTTLCSTLVEKIVEACVVAPRLGRSFLMNFLALGNDLDESPGRGCSDGGSSLVKGDGEAAKNELDERQRSEVEQRE